MPCYLEGDGIHSVRTKRYRHGVFEDAGYPSGSLTDQCWTPQIQDLRNNRNNFFPFFPSPFPSSETWPMMATKPSLRKPRLATDHVRARAGETGEDRGQQVLRRRTNSDRRAGVNARFLSFFLLLLAPGSQYLLACLLLHPRLDVAGSTTKDDMLHTE